MLKKSKIISGMCLIAQSIVSLITGIICLKKNKGLAGFLLGLGAIGGIAGAWLMYDECRNVSNSKLFDIDECDCGDDETENAGELFPESSTNEEDIHFSFAQEEEKNAEGDPNPEASEE
ncbi:MAG: hypothetical protein IJV00_06955 [Clostridia bacterium]|nr:hypothetical protein [Clostridia bacterium]